jgi:fatty-acyl-CoA synthase
MNRWCWEELLYQSESFAKGLVELGLAKGDRVGIYAPNMNEWVVAQFAASLSDLVLVNVNPSYQTHDLQYALNKVQMKALIMSPSFKSSNYVDIMQTVCPELKESRSPTLHSPAVPSLRHVILTGDKKVNGFIPFDDVYFHGHHADYSERTSNVNMMSPTNIQFTSGTTGNPKAALLSHHSILNNGLYVGANLAYTPEDRIGISVPLYHCFGMVMGNLAAVNYGCAMIYADYAFNPAATMDAVETEKITSLYGVPTMFLEYVKEQDRRPRSISSLRTGIVAGAICPPALMDQMTRNLNLGKITNMYGMTETSPVTFMLPMDAPLEKKLTTVGTIAPNCEAKIVDSEGKTVPRGVIGEIYTRGYTNMLGYWQDDVATKNTINSDGWVVTGINYTCVNSAKEISN